MRNLLAILRCFDAMPETKGDFEKEFCSRKVMPEINLLLQTSSVVTRSLIRVISKDQEQASFAVVSVVTGDRWQTAVSKGHVATVGGFCDLSIVVKLRC
ncbi:hypothetical protein CKAN_00265500 [Cinnamomum micranthum f. kanehirae]|uniref:Uncharacterized protein n=1 Tax=Cinnamomum micranthum f. kanehirae TaxID=337451 RepID=A0A3S3MIH6_9MAGN|nr:hypothetical protein CKAN_00265500 [Cinnamomum micranthum f. kanehirae]